MNMSEWISAKDRLPEFDMMVLVYCRIYGRYITFYSEIENSGFGNWVNPNNGLPDVLPPTHWMPLPEPPTQE